MREFIQRLKASGFFVAVVIMLLTIVCLVPFSYDDARPIGLVAAGLLVFFVLLFAAENPD